MLLKVKMQQVSIVYWCASGQPYSQPQPLNPAIPFLTYKKGTKNGIQGNKLHIFP